MGSQGKLDARQREPGCLPLRSMNGPRRCCVRELLDGSAPTNPLNGSCGWTADIRTRFLRELVPAGSPLGTVKTNGMAAYIAADRLSEEHQSISKAVAFVHRFSEVKCNEFFDSPGEMECKYRSGWVILRKPNANLSESFDCFIPLRFIPRIESPHAPSHVEETFAKKFFSSKPIDLTNTIVAGIGHDHD